MEEIKGFDLIDGADLSGSYLTFNIADAIYGVELTHVIEIIGIQAITNVPGIPPYIKGIINLRGRIVPAIDVRSKIGLPEKEHDERTCIIVIEWQDSLVGLIADSVAEVLALDGERLAPLPEFSSVNVNQYLSSVTKMGERLVLNIDCEKFLNDGVPTPHLS